MTLKCPTNGTTTKNSKYPRVELRENKEWDLLKGSSRRKGCQSC